MCSLVYYIKETVYDWLFVHVIRGRWRLLPASTYHSIKCRAGKECGKKAGESNGVEVYVAADGTSHWNLDGRYITVWLIFVILPSLLL
jgi:hypothetical protein